MIEGAKQGKVPYSVSPPTYLQPHCAVKETNKNKDQKGVDHGKVL